MLISIFAVVSLVAGTGLCLLTDAFSNFNWLWMLPLSAVGTFILQLVLWFLMIVIMGSAADLEKKQEEDDKFYRFVLQETLVALLPILGIRFHKKGFEQKLPEGRFLLVSNHLHDIDPAMLLRNFSKCQLGFIGKREVKNMFLAGPFLKMTMGQFLNRENDREALKTILECIRIIKEDKASIAVFPEGYIMPDRLLRPLRPGVFKIAQRANVPIVVCTLQNTQNALYSIKKLRGADVDLHLVGIIPAEEVQGVTTADIAHRVYTMMAEDLGPDLVYPLENAEST
jgi:1-acyl-sn-glycerol-3-phosphate acyltransferase